MGALIRRIKYIALSFFTNSEEPIAPDWFVKRFKLGTSSKWIAFKWWLRNPAHDFTWRVIGVHGKDWVRVGIDPTRSYALKGGWQWTVIKYKWWRLPYVSYINRVFRFRIGWGDAGNFTPLSIRSTRPDNITWGNNA